MQNRKTTVSIVLKTLLGLLALIAFLSEWSTYGDAAPRLFGYWVMLLAMIFYFASAVYLFFHRRTSITGCLPRLTACIVLNLLVLMFGALIFRINNLDFPTAGSFSGTLICFVIPILALVDWLNFAKKGALRTTDPWAFLAPSVIFASLIIITTEQLPTNYPWRYPYQFLNYEAIGLPTMAWLLLISVTLIIIGGYVLYSLDFVMSGELAKHIVLPKIKTIVVVEAPHPEISIDGVTKTRPAIQRKPKSRGTINDVTKVKPKTVSSAKPATSKPKNQDKKDKLANVGKLQPIKGAKSPSQTTKTPANEDKTNQTAKNNQTIKSSQAAKANRSDKASQANKTNQSNKKPKPSSEQNLKKDEFKIPQSTSKSDNSTKTKSKDHQSTKTQDVAISSARSEFKVPNLSPNHDDASQNSNQKHSQKSRQNSDKKHNLAQNSSENSAPAKNSDKNHNPAENSPENNTEPHKPIRNSAKSSSNNPNSEQKSSAKRKIRHF